MDKKLTPIGYLRLWHGDHNEQCDIAEALLKYDAGLMTVDEVLAVADEVDDGWREGYSYNDPIVRPKEDFKGYYGMKNGERFHTWDYEESLGE